MTSKMKKIYYTPSISVIEIEEAQIIAGSTGSVATKVDNAQEISSGSTDFDAAGYRSNLWE